MSQPHVRTQIRSAAAALLTGLPTTGANVFIGRTRPLPVDHDPTLLLFTARVGNQGAETARAFNLDRPRTLIRKLSLFVEGRVVTNDPPDDLLDQVAAEVEAKVATLPTLGGLVKNVELTTTVAEIVANGSRHEGAIRLEYTVTYANREDDPTTAR